MCSNTSSSGNGSEKSGVILSSGSKRARVPRRGPGVAELEKILREEETRVNMLHGFSSPPIFTSISKQPASAAPPFITSLRPSMATITGSSSSLISKFGQNGVVSISPEDASFPVSWKMKSDLLDEGKSKSGVLSENYLLQQRPPMGHPARLFDQLEHPSSQKSNHICIPFSPEQEKTIGMKRPQHFSVDDSDKLFHNIQISLTRSSPFDYSKTVPREEEPRKYDGSFLCPPKAPSPSKQRCIKEKTMDGCSQRSEEGANGKPFYCFLQVPETTNGLNKEIDEVDQDAIDLNLKL